MYWTYYLGISLFIYIISALILYEGQGDKVDRILSILVLTLSSWLILICYFELLLKIKGVN